MAADAAGQGGDVLGSFRLWEFGEPARADRLARPLPRGHVSSCAERAVGGCPHGLSLGWDRIRPPMRARSRLVGASPRRARTVVILLALADLLGPRRVERTNSGSSAARPPDGASRTRRTAFAVGSRRDRRPDEAVDPDVDDWLRRHLATWSFVEDFLDPMDEVGECVRDSFRGPFGCAHHLLQVLDPAEERAFPFGGRTTVSSTRSQVLALLRRQGRGVAPPAIRRRWAAHKEGPVPRRHAIGSARASSSTTRTTRGGVSRRPRCLALPRRARRRARPAGRMTGRASWLTSPSALPRSSGRSS